MTASKNIGSSEAAALPAGRRTVIVFFENVSLSAWIGFVILAFWALVAALAPLVAPHGVGEIVSGSSYALPGEAGLLGSDYLGRDVFSRLVFGAQTTIKLALASTFLAFFIGATAGFFAALSGGRIDAFLSRLNDMMLSMPSIMLALIVVTALGSGVPVLIGTVALIESVRVFRIARAGALDVHAMEFIEISIARGESRWWIMWHEILPNTLPLLLTDFGTRFNLAVLLISSLGFLGLGIQPPNADWGMLVRENLSGINYAAVAALAPALSILTLNLGINLIVDWNLERMNRTISEEVRR